MSLISRLEGNNGGGSDDNVERKSIFESRPLHDLGGNMKSLTQDWVFLKVNTNGYIMIWYIIMKH